MKHILVFDNPNFEKVHLHDTVPFASKYIVVPDEGDPEFKKHRYGKLGKFNKEKMFEAIDEQFFCPSSNEDDDLRKNIEDAINCASAENKSDTPDFILAEYLMDCLKAYDSAVEKREKWYGRNISSTGYAVDGPIVDEPIVADTPSKEAIQAHINGKNIGLIWAPIDADAEYIENEVMKNEDFNRHFLGKEVKKVIVVPNKLINFIV